MTADAQPPVGADGYRMVRPKTTDLDRCGSVCARNGSRVRSCGNSSKIGDLGEQLHGRRTLSNMGSPYL